MLRFSATVEVPDTLIPLQISEIECCLIQFFGLNRIDLIKGLWRNLVADAADFVLDGRAAPQKFVEGPRITFVFFVLRLRQMLVIPSIVRRRVMNSAACGSSFPFITRHTIICPVW